MPHESQRRKRKKTSRGVNRLHTRAEESNAAQGAAARVCECCIPSVSAQLLDYCSGGICVKGRLLAGTEACHVAQGRVSRLCDRHGFRVGTKSTRANDAAGAPASTAAVHLEGGKLCCSEPCRLPLQLRRL